MGGGNFSKCLKRGVTEKRGGDTKISKMRGDKPGQGMGVSAFRSPLVPMLCAASKSSTSAN